MTTGVAAAALPRERTDISEAVRTVPPPPIPELLSPSKIRVTDPDGADVFGGLPGRQGFHRPRYDSHPYDLDCTA